jgi:hypothetical protein
MQINPKWEVSQLRGVLSLPILGYISIKQGVQLWCILLFYDDFVG